MPVVTRLNIAPVRSLGLESRDEIELTELGVAEDRRYYLVDEADRLVDQLIAASLVQVAAWTNPDATALRLTFPDGVVVEDDVRIGAPFESIIYARPVVGHVVEGSWADALSAFLGKPVRVIRCDRPGGTRKAGYVSLVTEASLDRLGHHLGVGRVDGRRFRMLIELSGDIPHEEDSWAGKRIELGETILAIGAPVPRCAMTTHDPDSGEHDLDTLRAIKEYRGFSGEKNLVFGVWGDVERPGRIRLGDEVTVLA
ncbi:MAG: MOSC N-terminal beta barrel domain-containing protein [Candidatus Limnocylindrales bacterium]